jgi:hypothetical protein
MLSNRAQRPTEAAPTPRTRTRHTSSVLRVVVNRPLPPFELPRSAGWGLLRRTLHVHRFRWHSEDAFSGSNLYACRCGSVRPGL